MSGSSTELVVVVPSGKSTTLMLSSHITICAIDFFSIIITAVKELASTDPDKVPRLKNSDY